MSARFHYFSHLENLKTKVLVLTNPFAAAREALVLCRYSLHRASAEVAHPDAQFHGMGRLHRLLPYGLDAWRDLDVPVLQTRTLHGSGIGALHLVVPDATLPYRFALPALAESGLNESFAWSPHGEGAVLRQMGLPGFNLYSPAGVAGAAVPPAGESAPATLQAIAAAHPRAADLGPWGNPYRVEAWKAVGLSLAAEHPDTLPTLVVEDSLGELLLGLVLAARQLEELTGRVPYRLVGVTTRPYHQLAVRFEGGTPDPAALFSDDNRTHIPVPEQAASLIVSALTDLMGTMLVQEQAAPSDEPVTSAEPAVPTCWEEAVARLVRTRFIDEEDTVYLMRARY